MKLSKLILITLVGMIIAFMDITVDMYSRNKEVSAEQLAITAKAYMHEISHKGAVAFGKVKNEIRNATYEACMNNNDVLAYNMDGQYPEFDY